jgi:uncharacterized protein
MAAPSVQRQNESMPDAPLVTAVPALPVVPVVPVRAPTVTPAQAASGWPSEEQAIAATRAWLEHAVIGLNLCPFAKAPQTKGLVRYVVSAAQDPADLQADLIEQLQYLAQRSAAEVETTLLIHPQVLSDFNEYLQFVEAAEDAVADLDLEGVLQVASFHPQYQFAGTAASDISNATNRSPYPMLHLLREESMDRAVAAFPQAEAIYATNITTLEQLGAEGWAALQQRWIR